MKIIPINDKLLVGDPSNTVCDLKWNYPVFNFGRNEYRTCCRSPGNKVSDKELIDLGRNAFDNHPREIQHRMDMISGKKIESCNHCWNLEENNFKSPRDPKRFYYWMKSRGYIDENANESILNSKKDNLKILDNNPGLLANYDKEFLKEQLSLIDSVDHPALISKEPTVVELILGNTCDMKCMYCSHHYSTQWASERIKYGEIQENVYLDEFPEPSELFQKKFWEWFDNARLTVNKISLIGGEPLIMPEFYPIIEKLIEKVGEISNQRKSKISLAFVTNLNTNEKYFNKFLNLLPKINEIFKIEILISQESIGEKAEYIRNGLDWQIFDSNLRRLCQTPYEMSLSMMPAINVLSVSSLPDFVKYAVEMSIRYNRPLGIRQNIISDPAWQSPALLTPEFSRYPALAIDILKDSLSILPPVPLMHGRHQDYIYFLTKLADTLKNGSDNTTMRKKFVEWFNTYDERRGLNLLETFPEYREFYELCKNI